jgi:GT2 family glycosyltransferase
MTIEASDHSRIGLEASIIVPTRDRHELLAHTVRSLARQTFPSESYEIIVVDDGSRTPVGSVVELVRGECDVRIIGIRHAQKQGPNAARNAGIAAAVSDLLVFVDDDIEAPADWLSNVVAGAGRHPEAGCFAGRVRLRVESPGASDGGFIGDTELDLGDDERSVEACAAGANMIVRRTAIGLVGPFAPDLPQYFEEIEWQERLRQAGGTVYYLPAAWLWHRRTSDELRFRVRLRRSFKRGYGEARYLADMRAPLDVRRRLSGVPGLLLYSARTQTGHGVMAITGQAGFLWWLIRHPSRKRSTPAQTRP